MLQSLNPALQVAMVHTPFAHPGVPFMTAHLVPPPPPLLMPVWMFVSHPATAVQAVNLELHERMPHVPLTHEGVPFATAHLVPHVPQLLMSVLLFDSQPLAAIMSQSRKGCVHTPMPHTPALQAGVPFATAGQTLPHMPQLL